MWISLWITLNGKKVSYVSYRDTFLLLTLEEGSNDIVIKYRPDGLAAGLIISAVSIIISLIYLSGIAGKKKKETAASQPSE